MKLAASVITAVWCLGYFTCRQNRFVLPLLTYSVQEDGLVNLRASGVERPVDRVCKWPRTDQIFARWSASPIYQAPFHTSSPPFLCLCPHVCLFASVSVCIKFISLNFFIPQVVCAGLSVCPLSVFVALCPCVCFVCLCYPYCTSLCVIASRRASIAISVRLAVCLTDSPILCLLAFVFLLLSSVLHLIYLLIGY